MVGSLSSTVLLTALSALMISVEISNAQLSYPNFVTIPSSITVPEDTAISTQILLNIQVNDSQNNPNLISVSCNPARSTPAGACSLFSLTATRQDNQVWNGFMTLVQKLNYEANSFYNLSIQATDITNTNYFNLRVNVGDVQDNPPVFSPNIDAAVRETNATVQIIQYSAVDGDATNKRSIQYSLSTNGGGLFAINPTTGVLTNTGPLTYADNRWSSGVISIDVKASEVLSNGQVLTDPLSTSTITSRITLVDSNSNAPQFDSPSYAGAIVEGSDPGTPVPQLNIVIRDSDRSPVSSQFDITMDKFTDIFQVVPSNGTGSVSAQIVVVDKNKINYDKGPREFNFMLTAREGRTTEHRSASAMVNITLLGKNNFEPVFNPKVFNMSVSELAPSTTVLAQLNQSVTDADYGQYGIESVWYKFRAGLGTNLFKCDQFSGRVTVAPCPSPGRGTCLDYERTTSYTLVVFAVDNFGEGFTATATLYVSIINENDVTPIFSKQEYVGEILEGNQQLQPPPIVLNATDDFRNLITLSITNGDPQNIWRIDPNTKQLSTIRPVNYDDTPASQGYFQLTINGTNLAGTSLITARIRVTPVNRYPPVFNETYNVTISDRTQPTTAVVTIHATDGDSPNTANGIIRYRLQSGTGDNFVVDPVTGVVTVAQGARLTQPVYSITIVAEDQGNPMQSGSGLLIINVTPSALPPTFQNNPLRLFALETTPVSTVLGSANATSTGDNPNLVYDLIEPITATSGSGLPVNMNSNDKIMFAVNRTTGMISVNQPLSFDRIHFWNAIIRVVDQNSQSPSATSATASVIVTIWSVNKNPPTFNFPWTPQTPSINISVSQDADPNKPLGTFTATSPNASLTITYSLSDDYNGVFSINNVTGQVTANRPLSFVNDTNVKFVVVATDNGQPSLSSSQTVYVTVQNTNANYPVFKLTSYYAEIPENSPGGTSVIQVQATDADAGDFGTVRYSIASPSVSSQFTIDPVTGVITVVNGANLDRETQPTIIFIVNAFDSPNILEFRKYVSTEVTVNLTDINDNAPRFDRSLYIAPIFPADVNTDYSIVKIIATDPDLGNNGTVRYSIVGGDPTGVFKIDPVTGIITPATSLRTHPGDYQLTVMAYDLGTPVSLNNTITAYITVQKLAAVPPVWYIPASDNVTININEGLPAGTRVINVYANSTDGDKITYGFAIGNGAGVDSTSDFKINGTTGEITTAQVFIYELQNTFFLRLVAVSEQNARSYRYLTVNVLQVDNVNPQFPNDTTCCPVPYQFSVDKVSPQSSVIGVVRATLPNPYRQINYRILSLQGSPDNGSPQFDVVPNTGQIIVNGSLDELVTNATYRLWIESYYKDVHPFVTIVPPCMCNNASRDFVYITVVDNTQRIPRFSNSRYNICASDSSEIGKSIYQANNTNYDPARPVYYIMQSLQRQANSRISGENPVVYNVNNTNQLPFVMPPPNGTIYTNQPLNGQLDRYFTMVVNASFVGRSIRYDSTLFNVIIYIVKLKDEVLVTIDKPIDEVWANIDVYKNWITSRINNGVVCIQEVRNHISPEGVLNTAWTDILLYAIDGSTKVVIPPLDLDKTFEVGYREGVGVIGITAAYDYWGGFNYIPVAAVIGLIIGLLVLALILFICCCCCWSWLLKSVRYTEKEPLIYNAGTLGVVNPVWNQKMFESQQLSMAVAEGDGMDKTIALHGAYNGYDAGDGDVFGGDGASRLNLHGSQSGLSTTGAAPGLVHIEAPLHGAEGEASATTHRETNITVESAVAPKALAMSAPTGASSPPPPPIEPSHGSNMNGMSYSNMPHDQTTSHHTTTTTSHMVRAFSTGTMTDDGEDDDRDHRDHRAAGTVTRLNHSSYDAPVVDLSGAADRGPAKIGATLYQPFGITGEQRPQSVISGRETYMNEEDFRGTMTGGYRDDRIGARSAMSSLPLQKEIMVSDLRPESMYNEYGGYENAGGYQRDSDGGAYQGEIRLGTMREPLGSSSGMHETRYL